MDGGDLRLSKENLKAWTTRTELNWSCKQVRCRSPLIEPTSERKEATSWGERGGGRTISLFARGKNLGSKGGKKKNLTYAGGART